ncbi:uncharacterized protein LOC131956576 [Physella acuta]|uniref:uncharacterized protein LOC131956576 n=1 Tax=Physella acuta TaxID=109671 RepID=UPI0027DBA607|nr:uncharacterized protein LOC131956576 [Physella acuta]
MKSTAISLKITLLVNILLHTLTSFPLKFIKDKTLRINTNENIQGFNVSLFTNAGGNSTEKVNVQQSPVPAIWTLLRLVGRIHDNKTVSLTRHTLVLNVSHDIDKQTDDIHDLKQTDAYDIRNDIIVTRNDIELQNGPSKVVRNDETKIEVKSQLRKRSEKICTLSKERALILIKRIEHDYFELAGQAEKVTGDDSQEVEYYLYKYTSGGFIKMIYRIDKCHHRVNRVSYDKIDIGGPCENRAFGIGGSAFQGPIFFGRKPFCLETTFSNVTKNCILKNKYVEGIDIRGVNISDVEKKKEPLEFDCNKAYLDGPNGAMSPLFDAFFYATQAQRMLEEWFNYTKLQNPPITVRVHYGENVANAKRNNTHLLFGDGDGVSTSYATAPDVVGHELGHMVLGTDTNITQNPTIARSGFDESFSDFLGKTVEFYIFGMFEWRLATVVKNDSLGIRSLELPSMQVVEDMLHRKSGHYNGGVLTRVFYRMAKFWGIRTTMEALMNAKDLIAQKMINSYSDVSCTLIKAGYKTGLDMYEIEKFFKTVGIDSSAKCPIDGVFVDILHVGKLIKVSSRRRPFFRVPFFKSKFLIFTTVPRTQVRITLSTDRQGKNRVQTIGLGMIRISKNVICCGITYIHFSTGTQAEIPVQITKTLEF